MNRHRAAQGEAAGELGVLVRRAEEFSQRSRRRGAHAAQRQVTSLPAALRLVGEREGLRGAHEGGGEQVRTPREQRQEVHEGHRRGEEDVVHEG